MSVGRKGFSVPLRNLLGDAEVNVGSVCLMENFVTTRYRTQNVKKLAGLGEAIKKLGHKWVYPLYMIKKMGHTIKL